MNLYLIYRTEAIGYGEYDSAVVVAADEEAVKKIWEEGLASGNPNKLVVELIGTAKPNQQEGTIICSSFNAG